jgi:hypothetical protein
MQKNHREIIKLHRKVQNKQPLNEREFRLLDIVLNTTISSIMHDMAAEKFLIGGEVEAGDA